MEWRRKKLIALGRWGPPVSYICPQLVCELCSFSVKLASLVLLWIYIYSLWRLWLQFELNDDPTRFGPVTASSLSKQIMPCEQCSSFLSVLVSFSYWSISVAFHNSQHASRKWPPSLFSSSSSFSICSATQRISYHILCVTCRGSSCYYVKQRDTHCHRSNL
jgi:thiamine transporter ThiT